MLRSNVGLVDLREVFLTHYHADHYLGLPGMLKTFALRGREVPITIYGPPGLVRPLRLAAADLREAHVPVRARRARARATARPRGLPPRHVPGRARRLVGRLRAGRGRPAGPLRRRDGRRARRPERARARRAPARRARHARGRTGRHARRRCSGRRGRAARSCIAGDTAPARDGPRGGPRRRPARPRGDVPRGRARARARDRALDRAGGGRARARRRRELLALTHLSNRYFGPDAAREARAVFPETVVPRDFDIIEIPFQERGAPQLHQGRRALRRPRPDTRHEETAMTRMVQVALAEDVTEAEEIQSILEAGRDQLGARDGGRAPPARDGGRPAEGSRPGVAPRGRAACDRVDDRPDELVSDSGP